MVNNHLFKIGMSSKVVPVKRFAVVDYLIHSICFTSATLYLSMSFHAKTELSYWSEVNDVTLYECVRYGEP